MESIVNIITFLFLLAGLAVGGYLGWEVFLWSGEAIPAFGYIPIGVILGGTVLTSIASVSTYFGAFITSFLYE